MPMILNGTGDITGLASVNSSVSAAEIGYLDGVTSAIQNQINSRPVGDTGAWVAYTPSIINITLGNGSASFYYSQIGKTVNIRGLITLGSTSTVSNNPTITLPVANNTNATSQNATPLGHVCYVDSGATQYFGHMVWNSANTLLFTVVNVAATYPTIATVGPTVPFTWGASDQFALVATYEAA